MSTEIHNDDDLTDPRNGTDVELRELVYQSLEREGLISLLKAQLRAAVFKTIEKASSHSDIPNKPGYDGKNGRICRALVLDWLKQSHLFYTQDILEVETSGPGHPVPLTYSELFEHLHFESKSNSSEPILYALLNHNKNSNNNTSRPSTINTLPEYFQQSIDTKFPIEKINDINRVREHFCSVFSSTFDKSVLDAYLNKNLSSSATSIAKSEYEQICLKWLQACAKALIPSSSPVKQPSSIVITQALASKTIVNNGQTVTQARRATSPPSESTSSSSSSSSDNHRKGPYDFQLPTIMPTKKSTDAIPPPLLNFSNNDDDDTTSSIFSLRNATPAALDRLKNIDDIIRGDETPRTRTNVQKATNKDIVVEYDDESMSQSQRSSVDDITVDKASPSPSIHIDYLEDV
ncbi:unnamed protein product [Rotaria magnacalcarata]